MSTPLDPLGPTDPTDPPVLVTSTFRLRRADLVAALLRSRALRVVLLAAAVAGLVVAVAVGPTEGLAAGGIAAIAWSGALAARTLKPNAALMRPRNLTAWPDGRLRVQSSVDVFDVHLGALLSVTRTRKVWRLRATSTGVVLVPRSAFTAEQDNRFAELVAARRPTGSRTSVYSTDWSSTLPFDRNVADGLTYLVRRRGLGILAFAAVAGLFALVTDSPPWAVALDVGAPLVLLPALIALRIWFATRAPGAHAVRVALTDDGVELHSAQSSSTIAAPLLRSVRPIGDGLEVMLTCPVYLPGRAFRDAEHRREFEAGLRRLGATDPVPTNPLR